MSHTLTDLSRRMSNLIGLGTIAEVDHSSARVRVDLNGRKTAWLPVPAEIGENFRRWRPLRIGTQVLVACPAGDPANAIIVQIIYSAALPPPANRGDVDVILFDDGTTLQYDSGAQVLTVISAGALAVQTASDATVTVGGSASVDVSGPISVQSASAVTITAPTVAITGASGSASVASLRGNFALIGNLDVDGSISASGSITDAGGNTNNHSH